MKLGKYNFRLTSPTVMGICNVTPDSFSDGGKNFKSSDALKNIKEMVKNGASIIGRRFNTYNMCALIFSKIATSNFLVKTFP